MKGKEKCKALKEIRRQIAEENSIEFAVSECKHQGDCKGTCPKCEAELRYLERELAIRQSLGKAVCVVGISAAVCSGLTACKPQSGSSSANIDLDWDNFWDRERTEQIAGDIEPMEGTAPAPVELEGDVVIPEELDGDIAEPEVLDGDVEMAPIEELEGDVEMIFPDEAEEE